MPFFRTNIRKGGGSVGTPDLSYAVCYIKNGQNIPFNSSVREKYRNTNLNQRVIIGNRVAICDRLFCNAHYYNHPVNIPNSVTNCYQMFYGCYNLSYAPIEIPNSVVNCRGMFSWCSRFNKTVNGALNAIDLSEMFQSCSIFNQPFTIPNTAVNCCNMFDLCRNLNSPITMSNSVLDCSRMFYYCNKFNQPIFISKNAINCNRMFSSCTNFNQEITLPKSVVDASWMLSEASLMCSNIYINGNPDTKYMIYLRNTSKRINIFVTSVYNGNMVNLINNNATSVGLQPMSDGNGYYSANYNCYIYNNYVAT